MRLGSNDCETIYHALLTLESELIALRRNYGELTEAIRARDGATGLTAMTSIYQARDAIVVSILKLKPFISGKNEASSQPSIRSIGEIALRATILFVTAQLAHLRDLVARDPRRASRLFTGQLRSVDDVSALILGGFESAPALWTEPTEPGAPAPPPRGAEHHKALRAVRAQVAIMARDPELRRFLQTGLASLDWPALGQVCAQLAVALRLDMEAPPHAFAFGSTAQESARPLLDGKARRVAGGV